MTATEDFGLQPSFPPLLSGEQAPPGVPPFDKAVASALVGCDPGLIVWSMRADAMEAALVLAPECPLEDAVGVLFSASIGFNDALGALGPPELAIHHVWPANFRVNGACCGELRAAASTSAVDEEPDWLVIGIEIPFLPTGDGGEDPDNTCLFHEGCGDISPVQLLESWSRHTLVWLHRWLDEGMAPLHAAWRNRAWNIGEELSDGEGTFMGLDEKGGMLIKTPDGTVLRPLTDVLSVR